MERILRELVAIPSVCGDIPEAHQIIAYVSDYLEKRGMHVQHYVQNGFPSMVASPRHRITMQPTVLLAAHLDVASAPSELFTMRKEHGKYFGRGVFDMKFAAAAYLQLVDDIQDRLDDYDFAIMFTTDEEQHGPYGTGMLVEKGYRPSVCVLPDASEDWNIETFAKGRLFAEIRMPGIGAHGSRPWEGDSANSKLITLLHQLQATFSDDQQAHTDTFNVGVIQGGTVVNQVADDASAHIDIRFVDETAFNKRLATIQAFCSKSGATLSLIADHASPVVNSLDNSFIKAFAACVTAETGLIPQATHSLGGSDARFFSAVGIPCVVTSPSGGRRHAPDEWLDVASFEHLLPILRRYLDKVALGDAKIATDKNSVHILDSSSV